MPNVEAYDWLIYGVNLELQYGGEKILLLVSKFTSVCK